MPAQMKPKTIADLTRLQTYGSLYLGGIEPESIEKMYVVQGGMFNQIDQALSTFASADSIGLQKSAAMVESTLQAMNATASLVIAASAIAAIVAGTATAASVASTMGPIGGAVGALVGIIGGVVSIVLRSRASTACDESKCLPGKGGAGEKRHRRAIVGLNTPARSWEVHDHYCATEPYGGTKSACKARRALIVSHMNDGMWWWGRVDGNEDALSGTIIGVMGRVANGPTKGCEKDYWNLPYTPKLPGMPDVLKSDSDLSAEFKARQQAVTEVLEWMLCNMRYDTLSCLNNLLHNLKGTGAVYKVCGTSDEVCHEAPRAGLMRQSGNSFAFPQEKWVEARIVTSRVYASIRGMFQALVAMSQKLGASKAKAVLVSKDVAAPEAAKVLDAAIANANKPQAEQAPWPEKVIADKMNWDQLKAALREIGQKLREAGESAGNYGYAFDRVMAQRYSVSGRYLSPGGIRPTFWYSVGPWVPYAGAGVLGLGALALLYFALSEEDDDE